MLWLVTLSVATAVPAAAGDPPKPSLESTFTAKSTLTLHSETLKENGSGTGSVALDASTAAASKERVQSSLTLTIQVPGVGPMLVVSNTDMINDYGSGDGWTHMCTNATGGPLKCTCAATPVTGGNPIQNTSGWSYVGEATVNGVQCTQWLDDANNQLFVSEAAPGSQEIVRVESHSGGMDIEQTFGTYTTGPLPPATFVPPPEWDCPKDMAGAAQHSVAGSMAAMGGSGAREQQLASLMINQVAHTRQAVAAWQR